MRKRKRYVQLKDFSSDCQDVCCGVPQGSIFRPTLFILYIYDICNVSSLLNFVLFADDTNVFSSHDDVPTLCKLLNNELQKLSVWCAVNKLSLNFKKTNYMIFDNRSVSSDVNVSIDGIYIERVYVTNF